MVADNLGKFETSALSTDVCDIWDDVNLFILFLEPNVDGRFNLLAVAVPANLLLVVDVLDANELLDPVLSSFNILIVGLLYLTKMPKLA